MDKSQKPARGKKFMRDLGIYAIGNIGSKLITFLLIPFYTFFITDPADFGYYDICLTVAFCLIPLVCLQLNDGAFRFLIETSDLQRRRAIISFVTRSLTINSILLSILGIGLSLFIDIKYLGFIIVFCIAQSFYDTGLQLARGLDRNRIFTEMSIMNAFSIAVFSVLTVVVLDLGVPGIFIANIGARTIALIYLEIRLKIIKLYFSFKYLNRSISSSLLKYSLPLLPMIMLWWVMNSNNIFFIKHFLGLEENGIYAILGKFTGILFVLSNIFYQTWQQNAIQQYDEPDKNEFFSSIFNTYFFLLCIMISVGAFLLRMNYFWIVSPEYQSSSQYLFLNFTFVMMFAIAAFFEVGYQCAKRTRRIIPSIIIGLCVNLSGNYFLTPLLGLNGIIISGIISYIFIITYRIIDSRKYIKISFSLNNFFPALLLISSGVLFYLYSSTLYDFLISIILLILYILLMPQNVKKRLSTKFHSH